MTIDLIIEFENDRPGALADVVTAPSDAGIAIDPADVATGSRIVFGSPDIDELRTALAPFPG